VNNLPKVVAQQRRGRASNPRLLHRKSDALPLATASPVANTKYQPTDSLLLNVSNPDHHDVALAEPSPVSEPNSNSICQDVSCINKTNQPACQPASDIRNIVHCNIFKNILYVSTSMHR